MERELKQKGSNHIVKVVLFGPESTGKTTLSKALANHYNTVWVPEFARTYLQKKWDKEKKTIEPTDLLPIAVGQMNLENKLAKKANKILFCDTDLLQYKVYSEVYYHGKVQPLLDKAALENAYNLYLLTYIDTPWIADDLRDRPNDREFMFQAFKNALEKYNRPYKWLKGSSEQRLKTAVNRIDKLLAKNG
ncbi:MAG: nicotinate-nucleotide adenylyltransferase [Flavobacteriales bacterium]|nr:MAG: nicotinate-nucleotide adenylyltransferase [Flavobacteriales bacterium]PIE49485.1 MAG: nicotinate-nucleotide adenylyltransferase [Flavobacteriales bacterium]